MLKMGITNETGERHMSQIETLWKKEGTPHAGMNGFCQEGDCVQVPLSVLAKWGKIDCLNKKLYIVENPSIFAAICEKKKGTCACMCMNGQPRLASILLLDLAA